MAETALGVAPVPSPHHEAAAAIVGPRPKPHADLVRRRDLAPKTPDAAIHSPECEVRQVVGTPSPLRHSRGSAAGPGDGSRSGPRSRRSGRDGTASAIYGRERTPKVLLDAGYILVDEIGSGSFSTVYKAVCETPPHAIVAVKHVNATVAVERVVSEIRILLALQDCEHMISVLDVLRHEDNYYIVTEYVPHWTFAEFFKYLNLFEIRHYVRCLLTATKAMHDRGYVHRDVKPDNCLFSPQHNQFRLVDFGLAYKGRDVRGVGAKDKGNNGRGAPTWTASGRSHGGRVSGVSFANAMRKMRGPRVPRSSTSGGRRSGGRVGRSVSPVESLFAQHKGRHEEREHASRRSRSGGTGADDKEQRTASPKNEGERDEGGDASAKMGTPDVVDVYIGRIGDQLPQLDIGRKPRASHAGSRGFRAPEILMSVPEQTNRVDIWSVGVVLLSFLTGRYPFFTSRSDVTGICEIAAVVGVDRMSRAAGTLDRVLVLPDSTVRQFLDAGLYVC